jgi:hypothetical protein
MHIQFEELPSHGCGGGSKGLAYKACETVDYTSVDAWSIWIT